MNEGISRYYEVHQRDYPQALLEIKSGKKLSHWIWYIFPQLRGLGHSHFSEYYGVRDLEEAKAYLADPMLGADLTEISEALLSLDTNDVIAVMGRPDDMKLKSSMTLFNEVSTSDVFERVLKKFYQGEKDYRTLKMLGLKTGMKGKS